MITILKTIVILFGLIAFQIVHVLAVSFSTQQPTSSTNAPEGQGSQPISPTQTGDSQGVETAIDTFTFNFKEYDSTLDQKYIEEDHNNNQQGLSKAYEFYKKSALESYLAQRSLCQGDQNCILSAGDIYGAKMRSAKFRYEQMKAQDDIDYRAALSVSRQKIEEASQKRKEDLLKEKREYLEEKATESKIGNEENELLQGLEDNIAGFHQALPQVLIAPEEYYPVRTEYQKRKQQEPSPTEPSNQDKFVICKSTTTSHDQRSIAPSETLSNHGKEIEQSQGLKDCDSLRTLYDELLLNRFNWADQIFCAKRDSLLVKIANCLDRSEQNDSTVSELKK